MLDQLKPYYFEHLLNCVNRMVYYRDVSVYAAQNRGNDATNANDPANNNVIQGNIGCLVFTSGEKSHGVEWVAASFKANQYLKELRRLNENYVLLEPADRKIRCLIHGTQQVESFAPPFPVIRSDGDHDSEYLLLNFLAHLIDLKHLPNLGRLSVFTERIPCESCTEVMCRFVDKFQHITLDLFYMHDTSDRQPDAFLSGIGGRDIRLMKVGLHTVVDVIEVKANPRVVLNERAREQMRMFGGSPNQILQTIQSR